MEAECQCANGENARLVAEKGKCLIVCGAPIEPKYVVCRPCALGNHTGAPCAQYVPDYPRHLVKTCKACGFDAALHKRGSDGSLN
jgi:hypothetical protein